jgi:exopolyphosphatase/guanosine-5'-triphosphate,3'-diphosphate pyrophosphatase
MNFYRFAAIDIGSNAIRLLITNVFESDGEVIFKKSSLTRGPLRLGVEAFELGYISEEKEDKLLHLMTAYKHLMIVNQIEGYRACATSAMRDASNGNDIVNRIMEETGIEIEIIDGKEEAKIIYDSHIADMLEPGKNYMYMDVGGGSTELTLLINGKFETSRSFNIGTLRLLNKTVEKHTWDQMHQWVSIITEKYGDIELIGSGGNINKLYKLAGSKPNAPLTRAKLMALSKQLVDLTVDERIIQYGMNPDRADVIVPATEVFLMVSRWLGSKNIYVPVIGVADGIVRSLYARYKKGETLKNIEKK